MTPDAPTESEPSSTDAVAGRPLARRVCCCSSAAAVGGTAPAEVASPDDRLLSRSASTRTSTPSSRST